MVGSRLIEYTGKVFEQNTFKWGEKKCIQCMQYVLLLSPKLGRIKVS